MHGERKNHLNFIWGSIGDRKAILLSWDHCCRPLESEGLGVQRLSDQNKVFIMKLSYRLPSNPDSLWVRVLRKKYNIQETLPSSISQSNCSFFGVL